LRHYKAKRVKTRYYQEGVRSVWTKISGGRGHPWGTFFWFLQNYTYFAIWQCKLHRATCSRFDTILACGRQTDGRTELP